MNLQNSRRTMLSLVMTLVVAPAVTAVEIRTYEFILEDGFNYSSSCDQCPLVFGTRARVTGHFKVSLDFDSGTGVLESLIVTLVDVETLTGSVNGPAQWVPQPDRPLFDGSPSFEFFKPPLPGILESAGSDLILSPDGTSAIPPDMLSPPQTYHLTLSSDEAELDFFLPIIDLVPRITDAKASLISVVPEPSGSYLGLLALLASFTMFRTQVLSYFGLSPHERRSP